LNTGIYVSPGNSFNGVLAGSATFTGTGEDIRAFSEVTVNLYGEPSVAPGTLYFEFSPDGINWDTVVPFVLAGPQNFVPLPLRATLPFFRVRYVNGATPLTVFRLTTVFHWSSAKHITRVINQEIDDNEPVENVRAFLGGKSPDGPFTNQPASGMASSQSTNTPLGIGGVFTGSVIPVTGFVAASVAAKSDVNSAVSGLVFSFYADSAGARLLKTSVFTYGSAPNGTSFQVPSIAGPYMRITYTNGVIAQTSFEMMTNLSITAPPSDVLSISETINANTAAQITKSSIVGQQENGIFANSKLSNSGSQMVAVADRPSEVRNRVDVVIPIVRTALNVGGTVLYTVTPGKRLYISTILLTGINDAIAVGQWHLRDSATIKSGFIISSRAAGTPAAGAAAFPPLPQPMEFSTNVTAILITGVIDIAGFMNGYEEPI
jgi:hypothetical protein